MKRDLWVEGQSVTSLPKTKILKIKAAKKEKKEEGAEEGVATAGPAKGEAKKASK
jgi:hypothetical protein